MDDLSALKDALPAANKDLPTQSYYKRASDGNSRRGASFPRGTTRPDFSSRGGFANQRGPGRGRSRQSAPGPNSTQNTTNTQNRGSWANTNHGVERTFTFTENKNQNTPTRTQNNHGISTEDELKNIINRDPNSPNKKHEHQHHNKPKIKNTVDFKPSHIPAEMRVLTGPAGLKKYNREITSRDVIVITDLFCKVDDRSIYHGLLEEVENNKNHEWKLWHNDSHLIADDRTRRNQSYPTFDRIINTIKHYFDMDVQATRFNWFRDTKEWKPYHHDAAALKPEKAAVQNITVAVSFGTEREIAFQHAKAGSTVSFPLPNGTMYTFSNDVNVIWRHGVPQVPPDKQVDEGRISIVAWGWVHGVINVS